MIINDEIIAIKNLIVAHSDCEQVYLFGSYAYGTPRGDADPLGPSDYDFYVVLNDTAKNPMLVTEDLCVSYGHFRLNLIRQNKRLGMKTKPMPVDFLAGYRSRFEERSKNYPFEHTIAEKGVLLYDKYAVHTASRYPVESLIDEGMTKTAIAQAQAVYDFALSKVPELQLDEGFPA